MTQPIAEIPRPKAESYRSGRKIFLVPTLMVAAGIPEELGSMLSRYWDDVRSSVAGLEQGLTKVTHVYHESVCTAGDEGLGEVERVNPHGHGYVNVLCRSTASLEATENREALSEATDWRMCLSIGLTSEKVTTLARDSFADAMNRRYAHIASTIDETLGADEAGLCILSEDHRVQFPGDVQVFYVSPPSLDDIKRWAQEQMRRMMDETAGSDPSSEPHEPEDGPAPQADEAEGSEGSDAEQTERQEYPY